MVRTIPKELRLSLFILSILAILHYGKDVLIPMAIAAVLAMLFVNLSNRLEKKGIPRWASALISILLFLSFIVGLAFLLRWQIQSFAEQFSSLKQNLQQLLASLQEWVEKQMGINQAEQKAIAEKQMSQNSEGSMIQEATLGLLGMVVDAILVLVYTYLLLFYRTRLKTFVLKIVPIEQRERSLDIIDSGSQVAAGYMIGLIKMIVILWIMYGIGFSILGVENALFFAILCGLLELIPFVGNLTGTAIAILGVTAQGGDTNMILGVVGIYMFVQFTQTYFLEPLIVGDEVNLNPLATIFGLVAAEALWGIAGLLLAIPLMGITKIICDRIPQLQPYGYLLGNEKKRKLSFWKRRNR